MKAKNSPSILRSVLVAIFIFVGVFLVFEYSAISLVVANISHDMKWYLGKDEKIKKYNESLFLAETGDFSGAKSLLFPLLNEKDI